MRKIFIIIGILTLFCTLYPVPCTLTHADIKLKIAVVNPSQTTEQTTPVKYDLPKGIEAKNIIDIGGMELKYDSDRGTYYAYQVLTLKPSEKKVLEIRLEDVWAIPDKDLAFLKAHTGELVKKLKKTKHAGIGSELAGKIDIQIDGIARSQADAALSASRKMSLYYENVAALAGVKEEIGILENLVLDVGGVVEERVRIPKTLAVAVAEEEALKPEDMIELTVKISNPSKKKKQTANLKYDLPAEVMPKNIVDAAGLDVSYDFQKECFRVGKDNLELAPDETKQFTIKLRDIWKVPDIELESLKAHTQNLMSLLKGTEFLIQGQPIADKIYANLDAIAKSQSLKAAPNEHIAYYRDNVVLLQEAKDGAGQLEKILSQSGTTPGVTITRAERLKGGGPQVQRMRGYEGVSLIADTIFRGKAPNIATTWKIIFVILGFIGVMSAFFFALWYVKARKKE
ncbi:MAG: hypothetical protein V1927_02605 [Candidatus Omnitrophota bacterium]